MSTSAARSGGKTRQRDSVLASIELFRSIDQKITVSNILTFLYVCENEGISVTELAGVTGLSTATASRAVHALAPPGARGSLSPFLGLVTVLAQGPHRNSRTLALTPRGRELKERLDRIIGAAVPIDIG